MNPTDTLLRTLDAPPADGGLLSMAPMMLAIGAIFYFIVYRPQKKEADEHAKLVASLQRGDRVVTTSGIHARVQEARGDTLLLEIATNTVITVDRDVVRRKINPDAADGAKADAAGATKGA